MQEYIISGLTTSCLMIFHDYVKNNYSWSYKISEIYGEEGSGKANIVTISAFTSSEENELYELVSAFSCTFSFVDPNTGETVDVPNEYSLNLEIPNNLVKYVFSNRSKMKAGKIKWLQSVDGIYSHETPHVLPFNGKLKMITFQNEHKDVSFEIYIYKVKTNGQMEIVYTWNQPNPSRVAYTTDSKINNVLFLRGEGIATKIKILYGSKSADETIVSVYVEPTGFLENENVYYNY